MAYGTRHIREMLGQAIDAIEKADGLVVGESSEGTGFREFDQENAQRLLLGAAINAGHSMFELLDETFRLKHGEDGYTR